jgi:hypothetical protein
MKKLLLPALLAACSLAFAKLPAPDDATKAKAAEASARAAWQAKVDLYQLCKSQDKVAAKYGKKNAAKPVPVVAKPASAAASGTPVAAGSGALPPCADPGVFAYNPPEQKPLETSGAHSPSGTAASPPSVRPEAAQMQQPGKTSKP